MATKKTTTAPVKTTAAAPAKKVAAAAPAKPVAVKAPAPVAKKAPAKKAAAPAKAPVAAKAPAAAKPAAVAKAPAKAVPTVIIANVDVGFGNTLTIRGSGAGLSWESGILLACEGATEWTFTTTAPGPLEFKLLLNDELWSVGENFTAPAGQTTVVTPVFG